MKLLLLNQYGAGSGAPTGRILGELAHELERRGHEVIVITPDAQYGKIRRIAARLGHELAMHLRIVGRGLRVRRVDAIISLTSPACLAVTAAVLARLHRARHFHWAMDVYPEAGVRLGELPGGFVTRVLGRLMGAAYRDAARVAALDEDMRAHFRENYAVDAAVIAPFPPEISWPEPEPAGIRGAKRWLYSGNFGRAHEIRILLETQRLLEDAGAGAELWLQGHGPQFHSTRRLAEELGLRAVRWNDPVPQEQLGASLLAADVLVVTRRPEMKGLLLPSKLVLAELSGRRILWIGDTDGATALRLASAGHGVFSGASPGPIAAWLQTIFAEKSEPARPGSTRQERAAAMQQWEALLDVTARSVVTPRLAAAVDAGKPMS
jgi:glycosyltransferase involved in cell wall biosynthesis